MEYKVGDKVRIKSLDWYNKNKSKRGNISFPYEAEVIFTSEMSPFCGQIVTISQKGYTQDIGFYRVREDKGVRMWIDEMIEGLAEEETKPKYEDEVNGEYYSTPKYLVRPSGYQFVDENGNVINATKIILERKKKEYPKTFLGCCDVLGIEDAISRGVKGYKSNLLDTFQKLIICRDAYWKIAGEEMGLGKPWKPDWDDDEWPDMYYISFDGKHIDKEKGYPCCNMILIFPTEEMRDAFKENFDPDIEICKEFL